MKTDKTINPFELKPCEFFALWHGLDMPEYEGCCAYCEMMIDELLNEKFAWERASTLSGRRPIPPAFPKHNFKNSGWGREDGKNETRR